ncbi:hypothetical protein [Psychrobacter sp. AOP7-C1-14]|uniref:hypothetical protein n=1 Tax=Psychrobacter sp. AOP7-C1-14 TaxID=3457640 RepID=UPI00402B5816
MSLVDLIKKEDDKYISVSAFIKLVSNHTKDSDDLVIEYLGKFCLSDLHDNINVYIKNSANGYSLDGYITYLISEHNKIGNFRFYSMSELEKNNKFITSYFLKHEIFSASFIESLNLNPDSYKKPFIDVAVIDNPIDRDLDQNDQNYISALKYVNDLGKGIGSGKPLKLALEYLVKNISFSEVELYLYDVEKEKYFLVSQTNSLNYTTSIELLEGIYHTLDGSQRGINFSDTALKPFKYFYFEFSDLPDLRNSGDNTAASKESNQSNKRLPPPNLLERDKTGTPKVGHVIKTYDQLVEELATANNRIKKLEQVKTEANAPKQQEKELDVDEEPNLKDSAYFLIAVLKDLLLDIEITGYYFQSDKDKGKKEPTQTVLAQHIEGMGIKDLKTRNINGLFAKANAMLSDAKKS